MTDGNGDYVAVAMNLVVPRLPFARSASRCSPAG